MSAAPDKIRQEEATINLEIDGVPLKARRNDTLIEVADAAGIKIPRFCYHKKLSIAANCRMCMVEIEKVPKPLPACATPVAEGMKVHTRSPKALEAQKGTMEFLLINHPLDCPICDEGGECELQETSMGYGWDHSDYTEPKRVVKDQDIGPLIVTFMTRCIHCTRCVRFGEEVAGMKELGATGRGENMRIGTYIEKAVNSELSGNVIELCPVGALLSKPFLYTARAWELARRPSVAPHDCVGSNLTVRTRANQVMRVDPRENEPVNECWISDRDRYSYSALNGPDRLLRPMVRLNGNWEEVDWNVALEHAARAVRRVVDLQGAQQFGTLVSPSSTTEELYLAQRLTRGLGSRNVDHRLRQMDFRGQEGVPLHPWLGQPIADLEHVDAALLVGSYIRKSQPLLSNRLRKAANRGGAIAFLNPVAYDFNFPVADNLAVGADLDRALANIAAAVFEQLGKAVPAGHADLLRGAAPDEAARRIAGRLIAARRGTLLLGDIAAQHPAYATLCALGALIAQATGVKLGFVSDGANAAGAWLAGAVPHREAGGKPVAAGLDAAAMLRDPLKGYLLLSIEPECDTALPAAAVRTLGQAECVVVLSPFKSDVMLDYAHVLLPITPFSETQGSFVNAEGRWQNFAPAVPPAGEARPAWKVLRVMGNLFDLPGFDYVAIDEVREEVRRAVGEARPSHDAPWPAPAALPGRDGAGAVTRVGHVALYAVDNIVRRSDALQQTADARDAASVHVSSALARRLRLEGAARVAVTQDGGRAELPLVIDDRVPEGCALIAAGLRETRGLGPLFGALTLEPLGGA